MAHGTAQKCGRVGSCHILFKKAFQEIEGLFCFSPFPKLLQLPLPISNRAVNPPVGGPVVLHPAQ
jgi:hypothetical protein